MAARQLTKIDNHFLVKYVCDDKFQVRSRGKFRSEDMVSIGQCYQVQWGNKRQIEEAKVIATGSETEMKSQMQEATSETLTKSPPKKKAKTSVPKLPKPVVTKPPKATKPPKPLAKIIATASPPELVAAEAAAAAAAAAAGAAAAAAAAATTVEPALSPIRLDYGSLSPPPHLTADELKGAEEAPVTRPAADEQTEETAASPFETPARGDFRRARPSPLTQTPAAQQAQLNSIDNFLRLLLKETTKTRKATEANTKAVGELVIEMKVMRERLDKMDSGASGVQRRPLVELAALSDLASDTIPEGYRIPEELLRSMHRASVSVGNFGQRLVHHMFPELCGPTQLKHMYNWKGGGLLNKSELCPIRKAVVKSYVVRYYPEVKDEVRFQKDVVVNINEFLRRKEDVRHRTKGRENRPDTPSIPTCSLLDYMLQPEPEAPVYTHL